MLPPKVLTGAKVTKRTHYCNRGASLVGNQKCFVINELLLIEDYLEIKQTTSGWEPGLSFTLTKIAYNRVYCKRGILYVTFCVTERREFCVAN